MYGVCIPGPVLHPDRILAYMRLHACQACPSRKSRCEARHCNIHSAQQMRIFPWHRHPKRRLIRSFVGLGFITERYRYRCRFPAIPPSCHRFAQQLDDRSVPNPGKSVRGKPASITRPNYEARQLPCFRQTVQHIGWRLHGCLRVTISIRSRA